MGGTVVVGATVVDVVDVVVDGAVVVVLGADVEVEVELVEGAAAGSSECLA
jgi:hypothetical protein